MDSIVASNWPKNRYWNSLSLGLEYSLVNFCKLSWLDCLWEFEAEFVGLRDVLGKLHHLKYTRSCTNRHFGTWGWIHHLRRSNFLLVATREILGKRRSSVRRRKTFRVRQFEPNQLGDRSETSRANFFFLSLLREFGCSWHFVCAFYGEGRNWVRSMSFLIPHIGWGIFETIWSFSESFWN